MLLPLQLFQEPAGRILNQGYGSLKLWLAGPLHHKYKYKYKKDLYLETIFLVRVPHEDMEFFRLIFETLRIRFLWNFSSLRLDWFTSFLILLYSDQLLPN